MSQIVLTKYFVLHFMSAMKTHMEIFFPTSLLMSVDFPEFGTPTKLTKPDFKLFFFKLIYYHF